MPFEGNFDARQVQPKQGGGKHPVGNKFPFRITGTEAKATKTEEGQAPKGGLFEVEFTSPAGSIKFNYNLWNQSEVARRIANEQLSALCHATGIFQLDFRNDGKALLGAQGLMDVGFQKGEEPSAEKPEGGYVEIKKIYDMAGNEPGKAPVAQQSPQQSYQGGQSNPPQAQQGGPQAQQGWAGGTQQPSQNQAPQQAPNQAGGWGGNGQPAQPPQQNTGGGWQQNAPGNAPTNPPWGSQ